MIICVVGRSSESGKRKYISRLASLTNLFDTALDNHQGHLHGQVGHAIVMGVVISKDLGNQILFLLAFGPAQIAIACGPKERALAGEEGWRCT